MRLFNRLFILGGAALLFAAVLAQGAPTVKQAKKGVGPRGVVESTADFNVQEPDWVGPPRITRDEVEDPESEELLESLRNKQLPPGHDRATILEALPLSRGAGGGLAAAPTLSFNFEGINMGQSGGFVPPDNIMAAGPNHVIVAVNLRWNIYNKSGAQQLTTSFANWFASVNTRSEGLSDPKVIYDHYSGRWIVMCIGFGTAPNNVGSYFISVSDDSDPNGFWYKWATPGEMDGDSVTTSFPDYPGIGYDSSEAVYLSSRQFPVPGGGLTYAKVRILKKSELYRTDLLAPTLTYADFVNFVDTTTLSKQVTMKPAMCWGPMQGNFVVESPNFSGTAHDLWKINDPVGTPTMTRVATMPIGAFSAPPLAGQPPPGCTPGINTVDARITGEVTYRNGLLYYTFNEAHNFGSGTVAAIRYVKADTTGSLLDNIIYGANLEYMYFPNVTVSQTGKVGIGYSHSSSTQNAGARYVGNFPTDLTQGVLKSGDGNYCLVANGRTRWGDFSGCVIDPVVTRRVWLFNQYATVAGSWSTRCGYFLLQNSNPVINSDPGPQVMDEGDTITLNFKVFEPDAEAISIFAAIKKPTWATFTKIGTDSGVLVLTPGPTHQGVDTVRLRATDNSSPSGADTLQIIITVNNVNSAPSIAFAPSDSAKLSQCCIGAVDITVSDIDLGDVITIYGGSLPAYGSVIDNGNRTGVINLTPGMGDVGTVSAQVFATDGLDTVSTTIPIKVFLKGDMNGDGSLTAVDVVQETNCVFLGTPPDIGLDACDVCDLDGGGSTASDVVKHLNATFLGDPLPPC